MTVLLFALLLTQFTPPPRNVLVVDAAGAGDYLTIAQAVLAAQPNDVVLVETGFGGPLHDGFSVVGKPLVITSSDPSYPVLVSGAVSVTDLAAGQELVLAGLDVTAPAGDLALRIEDCAGSVRVEGCVFDSLPHEGDFCDVEKGGDGASIHNSASVVFSHTWILGGAGSTFPYDGPFGCGLEYPGGEGGVGLWSFFSQVAFYNCVIQGGVGGVGSPGGDGGDGIIAPQGGMMLLSATAVLGGPGGDFLEDDFGGGGDGGHGVQTVETAYALGATFQGAPGGSSGTSSPGSSGFPKVGPVITWSGKPRLLDVRSPAYEGTAVTLNFGGDAADLAYCFLSISQSFELFAEYLGIALIGTPKFLTSGICNSVGNLVLQLPVPELGGGVESLVFALQPVFVSTAGAIVVGSTEHAVLLDDAF
jgi:hypothetical protein